MTAWNPNTLKKAAEKAGVRFEVDSTYLDLDPYGKSFTPVGVVWHHTACGTLSMGNMPSLNWCRKPGALGKDSRACHIVVGRDGFLQIIAGNGAYHAGVGGPLKVNGTLIPKDLGNRFLLGIEIEASSTTKVNSKDVQTPKSGMNPIQLESVAKFCAALFDIMKWDTGAAIRHKDWSPNRKVDVGIPLVQIHALIDSYRKAGATPTSLPKPKPPVQAKPPAPTAPTAPPEPKPVVRLLDAQPRKKNDSVRLIQEALYKEVGLATQVSPLFNAATKAAYAKWQKKIGYIGADADGIPGAESLKKLGRKYGFTVKSI